MCLLCVCCVLVLTFAYLPIGTLTLDYNAIRDNGALCLAASIGTPEVNCAATARIDDNSLNNNNTNYTNNKRRSGRTALLPLRRFGRS